MSKKVDTFEDVDNKIIALGDSSTSPSNLKKKGINKMELTEKVPRELYLEWLKEGILPNKAIIDDDYTLARRTLRAEVISKTVYTNQQGGGLGMGDPIMNAIRVEVVGGKGPYTYNWGSMGMASIINGQGTSQIGVLMSAGPVRYNFSCTVKDSQNTTVLALGYIDVIYQSGSVVPPDKEEPAEIPPEVRMIVEIRDPKYRFQLLENFEVLGDGSPIDIEFMADAEGGIPDYTYEWKMNNQVLSTSYKPTITFPTFGTHILFLSATDSVGNKNGSNVYVTYAGENSIECDGDYQHRGNVGIHEMTINYGTATGTCGVWYDMYTVPDAIEIWWDGVKVDSTSGLVSGKGTLTFEKTKSLPTTAVIRVEAPYGGTAWELKGICPE